jgi:hypothetical protein
MLYPPSFCYRNAVMFGLELASQELATAVEQLPKRNRTRRVREQLSDSIEQRIYVVHGSIAHDFGYRFAHAWIEYNGLVYDPTFSILAPVEEWYTESGFDATPPIEARHVQMRVGHAVADARYPLMVALRTALRHTWGPWAVSEVEC